MSNDLMKLDEVKGLADVFVKSGFFADSRDASQAIVKILAGHELGFQPIASMTGIYIVNGKPALSANLMASRIKSSGKYDYRLRVNDASICEIEFLQKLETGWITLGTSKFTMQDAQKAGTKNLEKYPRNMLFARAMSNGVKWFCPDIMNGVTAYTPEELGADVDEEGEIIDAVAVTTAEPPASAPAPANGNGHETAPAQTLGLPEDHRFDKPPAGNADKPKNARPRVLTGRYATQIMTEAKEHGWACDKNGEVVGVHLLNAIRLGGFKADTITDDNWEEALAAMRKHYADKEPQEAQAA